MPMDQRLPPRDLADLCQHALALEKDAVMRFEAYAARMREIGAPEAAGMFQTLAAAQRVELRALVEAAGGDATLPPWEYEWRVAYLGAPDAVAPASVRDALARALAAGQRAEAFYRDTADHARDPMVRGCAEEMGQAERRLLLQLEQLLAQQPRAQGGGQAERMIPPAHA
jgi:Rubrerythrin